MDKIELQQKIEAHLSSLRSVLYLMAQPKFVNDERMGTLIEEIMGTVDGSKRNLLVARLKSLLRKEYKLDKSIYELRDEAREMMISNWSRLDKETLRTVINARRKNQTNLGASNGHQDVASQDQDCKNGHCIQGK